MAKRARERARLERQEAKRQRRESSSAVADAKEAPDEAALMEEFRVLSERNAAGLLAEDIYAQEKHRIFVELGIETDEAG
jgi:hypothetical protein